MSDPAVLADWLSAALLVAGAFFSLVAGVGLLVLPDMLSRMHAAAKPQVLGLLLMLAGLAVRWHSWVWLPVLLLAWIAQMVTAPVSSHLVGRAGYRTKHGRRELLHRDDLARAARAVVPAEDASPRRSRPRPGAGPQETASPGAQTRRDG